MSETLHIKPRVIIEGNQILRMSRDVQYIHAQDPRTWNPKLSPQGQDVVRQCAAYNARLFGIMHG